ARLSRELPRTAPADGFQVDCGLGSWGRLRSEGRGGVDGPLRLRIDGPAVNLHTRVIAVVDRMQPKRLLRGWKTRTLQSDFGHLAGLRAERLPRRRQGQLHECGGWHDGGPLDAMVCQRGDELQVHPR